MRLIKDQMRSKVLMSKTGCARGLRRESRDRRMQCHYMSKDDVLASEAEEDFLSVSSESLYEELVGALFMWP